MTRRPTRTPSPYSIHRFREGLRWRGHRLRARQRVVGLERLAERLGFPRLDRSSTTEPVALESLQPTRPLPIDDAPAAFCAATVCTGDHIPSARTLVRSFRACHPDAPIWVLVVDGDPVRPPLIEGARVVVGELIGYPSNPYTALELDASQLCCAAKPWFLRYLFQRRAARRIVYLDSDILVMHPLDRLLELLDTHELVVTPHMRAPLPMPEATWERPALGEVASAGVLNAGLFGMAAGSPADLFLEQWLHMLEAPTAFIGAETEQHAFNWITCFSDRVALLRDPAYNVAYWNLHERSLRLADRDGPSQELAWTVDGSPLVAFHFSGFQHTDPTRLSSHDNRHSIYHHPALARLVEHYSALRFESEAVEYPDGYRYSTWPSGARIDRRMRSIFKHYQAAMPTGVSPWTDEGERILCRALLLPAQGSGSLLPILIKSIYDERPDLQAQAPEADLDPGPIVAWFSRFGTLEYG
ncbi:MAG: hypothetical protein MI919_09605, partial [Holophagales bacterium]|nr:hypothetical protein [Holophagales bacterium]